MDEKPRKSARFYMLLLGVAALAMAIGIGLGAFDSWLD